MVKKSEIGFGQAQGQKSRRGDNKTPRGMYFVVEKYKGEFPGEYGDYFGGHWIKINYPNEHDAAWGAKQGLITGERARSIAENWRARKLTAQKTPLGGGIGFHGWAHEWTMDRDGPYLSWGCLVAHLADIPEIFELLPVGTMVVIR